MDESQRRAWRALGLGPEWAARGAVIGRAGVPPRLDEGSGFPPEIVGEPAPAPAPDEADPVPGGELPPSGAPSPDRQRAIEIAALDWQPLRDRVAGCTACGLCRTRSRTVFGAGATRARWMLVGEAPGAEEDARGEPFVGKAGQLLDSMLGAIGLDRSSDVFIANVLKCRPPRNRDPLPEEVAACEPFLLRQLELVSPDVVLVLGRFAAQSVLGTDASIASLRGRIHRKEVGGRAIPLVVSYHPAYLLRTPADKSKSWADLLLARRVAAG